MKLTDDKVLQEDIEKLTEAIPSELANSSVLVTGATGLIGGMVVFALLNANFEKNMNIRILASARNEQKAMDLFGYAPKNSFELVIGDVRRELDVSGGIDYIIHGASTTSSKYFVENPVETIMIAFEGTKNILELAKNKHIKGMVYLSSLEVYGTGDLGDIPLKENVYGPIDSISIRSSYSEGKKIAECLCASYAAEYGVPVKIARLCQTFGAGVGYNDGRVFAQFARSVIEGTDIVLKTDGSTKRNYCYISDAVSAIFTVLAKGGIGEAYNVANKDTFVTIREMAEMLIADYPESGSSLRFDIAQNITNLGYNPKLRLALDTEKLEKLGWCAKIGLKDMFKRLIESMKFSAEENNNGSCSH